VRFGGSDGIMNIELLVERLREYLPITFGSSVTDEYIQYIEAACIENFNNDKHQFSFIGFHLLYMCYIYKEIWQGCKFDIQSLVSTISTRCNSAPYDSPFRISEISEKDTIKFLNHIGFHQNQTKQFATPVDCRNDCAHASGFIQYDKSKITQQMETILEYINAIQNKKKEYIVSIFEKHFKKNFNPDDPGSLFPSGFDAVENFNKHYILSHEDLNTIIIGNKSTLDYPSDSINALFKKVFLLLLIGWNELNYREIEDMKIALVFNKLTLGIEKQNIISINDLLQNELLDIVQLIPKEQYGKYLI
jgi:hypothetical protein